MPAGPRSHRLAGAERTNVLPQVQAPSYTQPRRAPMAARRGCADSGTYTDHSATTMPTFNLRPQALADRLPTIVTRPEALARRATTQARASKYAKPLLLMTTRWQVLGAAAVGLVLLAMYVLTLQTAVERGEALRAQQRQQGIEKFGPLAPADTLQTVSTSNIRT